MNRDDLRALAKAATPGPWSEDDGNIFSVPLSKQREEVIMRIVRGEDIPHPDEDRHHPLGFLATTTQDTDNFPANAAFIAAASPSVIIGLLDEIEDWRKWDDRPLPEDEEIDAAFPTRSDRHDTYAEAMRLVGARYSKGELVALVNWLLIRAEARTATPSAVEPEKR